MIYNWEKGIRVFGFLGKIPFGKKFIREKGVREKYHSGKN